MKSPNAPGILTKQQKIERYPFEMFVKVYPLPAGIITHRDKPDVLITGDRTIGIEITNFYLAEGGSPACEQVQRKRREAAVAQGHRLYKRISRNNIELTFGFDKDCPIQDVANLAARIAALGQRVEGQNTNGQIRRDVFQDIPELTFVYLYARELQYRDEPDPKFPNGPPNPSEGFSAFEEYGNRRDARALREGVYKPLPFPARWKLSQVHSIGLMSTARLRDIITEKEAKAKEYAPCDAYWLLVVVDFTDLAQDQEIRVDGLEAVKSSIFEKIIIYKTGYNHIVEVTAA
jgi:hypothetical protein